MHRVESHHFSATPPAFGASIADDPVWILRRFSASENYESLDYCVALFAWSYV